VLLSFSCFILAMVCSPGHSLVVCWLFAKIIRLELGERHMKRKDLLGLPFETISFHVDLNQAFWTWTMQRNQKAQGQARKAEQQRREAEQKKRDWHHNNAPAGCTDADSSICLSL
jgi:hypothetical protein